MKVYLSLAEDLIKMRPYCNYFHLLHDCLIYIVTYIKKNNLNKNNVYFYVDLKSKICWNDEFIKILSDFVNITNILPKNTKLIVFDKMSDKDYCVLVKYLDNIRIPSKNLNTIVYKIRTGKRYILNDAEIIKRIEENFGQNYKIVVVDFDKKSFNEQIKIMSGCKLFIGCHGAGLVNAYFMEPETNMLELFPESFYVRCFPNVCDRKNIKHHYLNGTSIKPPPVTLETYMQEMNTNPEYNNSMFRSLIRDIQFTMDVDLVIKKINEILQ